ncbi:tandem-95 repeat protein [Ramlibacter terrae]|uniref:Tandem-95 repeat protein n=1 Tax=Ramlibacter terrae TaxID=2732511 RepID=A0ABX6P080_9BURK|nr:tandem-95 repeat protein [Ramlibacter terrae]
MRFTDDAGNFATRVISLSVAADPDIAGDAVTVAEDGSVTTAVFGNDTFENAAPAITAVTSGAHGTVTIVDAAAGTVLYTPDANWHGTDSYTYTVTSGGVTETATVTVTVTSVDDATAFSGNTTGVGTEDIAAITGVLGVSDADGIASPGFAVTTGAGHGTATIDPATGARSYTPAADYNGPDSFTVTVTDSEGHTATRVISVSVVAAVDIAANSVAVAEDASVTTNLLANDSFEGTPAITAVTNGAHGTVTIIDAAAGTVRYTPDANFHGNDTYTYTVTSGGVTETATVTVTVSPVDDATSFSGATSGAGVEDGAAITGTLGATDADGMAAPAFTVTAAAAHGTATVDAATGAWTYVPAADYNGADSFTVTVTDDDGNTSTQVISVAVSAVPDIRGDSVTLAEDGSAITAVRGNDSFEGATPTVTAVTNGAHGTVTIVDAAAGTIRYTPDANWHGNDSYTYTVTSGGVTETATVSVTVTAVDDATTFSGNATGVGAEDAGAISGVLSATDADGMADPDYTVTTAAAHGTATIDPITGSWSYTPDADYRGPDSFTVTVTDDDGNTATRTVNLSVTPVVDIAGDTASTAEDTAVTRDVLANDSFESADRSITAVTHGAHGTVTVIDADRACCATRPTPTTTAPTPTRTP